ncbi:MAG TPA: hypothetical protein VHW26_06795 [Solirubrobacteraceae bacterium]|jgi:hypothetical protein|nr:hypothetical protein [Solirubrobacteraceae bacterium]
MTQRLRVLDELGVQIERLVATAPARRPASRRRLFPIAIAIALLGFAAAALAASGAFTTGAPVRPGVGDLTHPRSGDGGVRPGGVSRILAETPDPAGGPPWGLRVIRTTRGLVCLQVGRVVGGRIGVLGQDDLFSDDGRFHPLAAAVNTPSFFCYPPDADGHLFVATGDVLPASGYELRFSGPDTIAPAGGCAEGGLKIAHLPLPACPAADERALYFGMLGPDATRLTYAVAGRRHTVAPGSGGAYLVALRASKALGGFETGLTPEPGAQPIRRIVYRDGSSCDVPVQANGPACRPVGYLPVRAPRPSQVVAPLHITHPAGGLRVDFTARVAVTSAAAGYVLAVNRCTGGEVGTGTQTDVPAGERVTLRLAADRIGPCPHGAYTGAVYYEQNAPDGLPPAMLLSGAARRGGPSGSDLPVGRFSLPGP